MWAPISLMVPYCENCLLPNWASWGLWGGGGSLYCEKVFSQIHFFQEELYPPLYTFLWVELVHLLSKAIISMLKP